MSKYNHKNLLNNMICYRLVDYFLEIQENNLNKLNIDTLWFCQYVQQLKGKTGKILVRSRHCNRKVITG
jgi:hypothetical protein